MRASADMTDLKWLSQVKRGLLELCILNLVHQDPKYGYQIVKRLTSVPGLVAGAGTVYPLLSRLKRDGLLSSSLEESPQGPARRTYVLTPAGRRHMRSINEAWREIAVAVDAFMAGEN
jgi:PadR family transcriptional regulator, regulatory protein PadR